jgi:hypothetical protein
MIKFLNDFGTIKLQKFRMAQRAEVVLLALQDWSTIIFYLIIKNSGSNTTETFACSILGIRRSKVLCGDSTQS